MRSLSVAFRFQVVSQVRENMQALDVLTLLTDEVVDRIEAALR